MVNNAEIVLTKPTGVVRGRLCKWGRYVVTSKISINSIIIRWLSDDNWINEIELNEMQRWII